MVIQIARARLGEGMDAATRAVDTAGRSDIPVTLNSERAGGAVTRGVEGAGVDGQQTIAVVVDRRTAGTIGRVSGRAISDRHAVTITTTDVEGSVCH